MPDEIILQAVLRHWGLSQYRRRLRIGAVLPAEGLALDSLADPCGRRARDLLVEGGLPDVPSAA